MASYGEIRFRLSKLIPGVDLDILDGWIQDRYQQILDRLEWDRKQVVGTFQTKAEYSTGTVGATNGSTSISGTGTTWTSAMTGRMIRIAAREEFYGFTYVSATSGTLDRGYEGTTAASGLTYRINDSLVKLPSDMRLVESIESFETDLPLEKISLARLNGFDPRRNSYGNPEYWCPYMDANTDPPVIQVELYPVPTEVKGFRYQGFAEQATPTASTTTILPWVRPMALIRGVQADAALHREKPTMAAAYEAVFEALVRDMAHIEGRRQGPKSLGVATRFTSHLSRRWMR